MHLERLLLLLRWEPEATRHQTVKRDHQNWTRVFSSQQHDCVIDVALNKPTGAQNLRRRPFMPPPPHHPPKSKTKLKAIICALPQGGHLNGNNYVVSAAKSCLPILCFYLYCLPLLGALKPFNYYHLIIITFNVSLTTEAGDWQRLGRCVCGFNHHQIELLCIGN